MPIDTISALRRASATLPAALLLLAGVGGSPAVAATPGPGWTVSSVAEPSDFSSTHNAECAAQHIGSGEEPAQGPCDRYRLLVRNVGSESTSGSVTITDTLPPHIKAEGVGGNENQAGAASEALTCAKTPKPHCTYASAVPPGGFFTMEVQIVVEAGVAPSVTNGVTVEGGGAPTVSASAPGAEPNMVNGSSIPFEFTSFAFGADGVDGAPDVQAGDHPYGMTVNFAVSTFTQFRYEAYNHEKEIYSHYPVQDGVKDVTVDLPPGFVGDPQVAEQCSQNQLVKQECPPASEVGTVAIQEESVFKFTGETTGLISAVYNMIPDAGYPAEFAFRFTGETFAIYANVAHTAQGYVLRAFSPGIVNGDIGQVSLTFFGDPGEHDGLPASSGAFLTNPGDCSASDAEATVRGTSWGEPDAWITSKAVVYPHVTGCNLLQFNPTVAVEPEVKRVDTPSGYEVDLKVPQAQQSYAPVLATPDLKDATVTLPAGVSISPSAADGLAGCQETGPEGIDIPSGERLPDEAGEGEEIGVDGLARLAKGHCPAASQIGTVEIETPLLPAHTLTGHVYLAQPKCGGAGQSACTEASATNGELYGLYIEAEGSGVVIKLPGTVSANPSTGQLTGTFKENPQLPFSELKLHFNSGPRAPLANPQSCGSFAAVSTLTSWGGQETSGVSPSFGVDWDGKGGACPASLPFAPGFSAGTVQTLADAFTPFTMTLSRKDGEQDLGGVSLTMPPGVAGMLAKVPLCGEPQANLGTCPEASRIGTVNAAAGAGSHPFWLSGPVYLTGPYNKAPFGLSIVVPAKAGPFNLGNVIERATINVDPHTAQVTVAAGPLQQSRDGVPFRLKALNVTIDRPGFMFNPTNCSQLHMTGTISGVMPNGSPGSSVAVSSPFAVANCANLPFKPKFSASTSGKTSRKNGTSLKVRIVYPGANANLRSVKVKLPKQLPSRLSTLQKACTDTVFNVNPAACPAASRVGTATTTTPVLSAPLSGPVYFVSHGTRKFPDLVMILQGDGVTVILDGETFISKEGITSSTFRAVPDVPFSSFELNLPKGPYSTLTNNGNLCKGTLLMPTALTGQNGAVIKQSTKITVTDCPKAKKKKAKRK
jgi:hypothetical protein